jgi:hypothetical protein
LSVIRAAIAAASFDHLVGGGEQRRRHRETERPGGMVVETSSNFDACTDRGW